MIHKLRENKGFTLIEVLIVVVIIGVLAALIMPRMLTAPDKAIVAEGNQMLGTLVRAQQVFLDMGSSARTFTNSNTDANWAKLGLIAPGTKAKFTYSCSATACSATYDGKTMSLDYGGNWSCGGFTNMTAGGCTV